MGEDARKAPTEHPAIRAIAFVGESRTGSMIMSQGADTPGRVHFELGDKNRVVVFDEAGPDRALASVISIIYSMNGERCTSSLRLEILHTRILRADPAAGRARIFVDTVFDNAANAGIEIGDAAHGEGTRDPRCVGAIVIRDGIVEEIGLGAGVLDDPVEDIVWLVHRLAEHGAGLAPGDIVLSGSLIRPIEAPPGSRFDAGFGQFGRVRIDFGRGDRKPNPTNLLNERLARGETLFGFWLSMADAYAACVSATDGFDRLPIDAEHTTNDIRSILAQLRPLEAGPSLPVVRLPDDGPTRIAQALDIDAQLICRRWSNPARRTRRSFTPRTIGTAGCSASKRRWRAPRASQRSPMT